MYETIRRQVVGACPNHEREMKDALRRGSRGSSGGNTSVGSSAGTVGSEGREEFAEEVTERWN